MADDIARPRVTPSDFNQMLVVWQYEILKYLRSRRLIAMLAIVGVLLALEYVLPPALGDDYSGTESDMALMIVPADLSAIDPSNLEAALYVGFIDRDTIEPDTLELFIDGQPYSSQNGENWIYRSLEVDGDSRNVVLFMQDVGGNEIAAAYDWHVSARLFELDFLGYVSILIVICAVSFAADSLVGEFQSKTGYLIFPNAIKRGTLFLGKFMASVTVSLIVIVLFYVVVAALSLISAKGIDDDLALSFGFATGFLFAATGIAYFISSIMKGSTGAIVLTFFLMFMILPIVDSVSTVADVKVEGSVTFAAGAIIYILMDPYPPDGYTITEFGVMEAQSFYPTPATAIIVLMAYAIVACALSTVMFKRKQLAG